MSGPAPTLPGLDVPPVSLRLRAPAWGIDPNTRRIALATLTPSGPAAPPVLDVGVLELAQADKGAQRLALAHRRMVEFFGRAAGAGAPALVFLEQPFGDHKKVHPQSQYMVGVVLCALGQVLGDDGIIVLIDPMSWKRDAMGRGYGGARKDVYVPWAQSVGYDGEDEDEAAAVGIATAAGLRVLA